MSTSTGMFLLQPQLAWLVCHLGCPKLFGSRVCIMNDIYVANEGL